MSEIEGAPWMGTLHSSLKDFPVRQWFAELTEIFEKYFLDWLE